MNTSKKRRYIVHDDTLQRVMMHHHWHDEGAIGGNAERKSFCVFFFLSLFAKFEGNQNKKTGKMLLRSQRRLWSSSWTPRYGLDHNVKASKTNQQRNKSSFTLSSCGVLLDIDGVLLRGKSHKEVPTPQGVNDRFGGSLENLLSSSSS